MPQNSRSLGDLIREQRKLARLSLRDLAGMTRVSNAYLSQVERGIHEPSLRVLRAVADALEVPLEVMVPPADGGACSQAETPSVEESIRVDALLGAEEKQALLTIYRSLVGRSTAPGETVGEGGTTPNSPESREST